MKLYNVQDIVPLDAYDRLGRHMVDIRAIKTGITRPPKKGEWFISGAVPEAYQAKEDMTEPRPIALLVRIKTITIERIEYIDFGSP